VTVSARAAEEPRPTAAVPGGAASAARRGAGGSPSTAAVLVACLGVALALRLPGLSEPLDRDHAAYATLGRFISWDRLPYRDLFDHSQPLIYGVYMAIEAIAPASGEAIRLTSALVAGAAAWVLFVLLRGAIGRTAAVGAALFAAVAGATRWVEGTDFNQEHLLILVVPLAVLVPVAFARTPDARLPTLCGLLIGVAAMTKAVAAPLAIPPLVALLTTRGARAQSVAGTLWRYAAGAAVLPLAFAAFFLARGAGRDFLLGNVTYNRDYVADQAFSERFQALGEVPGPSPLSVLLVSALIGAFALLISSLRGPGGIGARIRGSARRDLAGVVAAIWFAGALAGALAGGRPHPHYFAPVVPAAVAVLAVVIARLPRPGLRRAGAALAAALAIAFLADGLSRFGMRGEEIVVERDPVPAPVWMNYEPVARELRDRSEEGDRLFVAGAEPGFYWASGVLPATRLIYDYPLDVRPELGAQFERQLCGAPPRWVVLPGGGGVAGYPGGFPSEAGCLAALPYELVAEYRGTQLLGLGGG
jgi:hypothetical protein